MKRNRSNILLITILLVGLVIGSVIGEALGGIIPIINQGKNIGLSTTQLDLGIVDITFGFNVHLSIAGSLGIIIAIILYQNM